MTDALSEKHNQIEGQLDIDNPYSNNLTSEQITHHQNMIN
jgi:hypothetical protein